ncbi:MAG: restriction endonuclease subunit S [Bacteroidales bacterium]|nr:restriction endonuclease subunit S [Bacteroidales bacterium]
MSERKEVKLGDLGTVITGKTPSKKYPEDWGNVMPFITPSDYKNYRRKASNSDRKLSENGIKKLRNKVLPKDSILVTCIGSDMGKVVMNDIEAITNQQINSIVPNTQIVSRDFLYYRLVAMYEILRIYGGDGTAVPIINKGDFENLETDIPPLPEQKAIAEVLSSLDDKIDLLHRQNKTLEQMAETLFRQWFLPVRDRTQTGVEEAREDWEERPLKEIYVFEKGFEPGSKNYLADEELNNIRFIRVGDMFNLKGNVFIKKELALKVCNEKDLLMSFDGTVGRMTFGLKGAYSSGIRKIYSNNPLYNSLGLKYLLFKSKDIQELIKSHASGTVILHASSCIKYLTFSFPSKGQIKKFNNIISPFFDKILKNKLQIRTLEKLRDILLPKLMNGEVRVKY